MTAALLDRLQRQDPTALHTLYEQARPTLLRVIQRVTPDPWDAEEVLQETLWAVSRKAHTVTHPSAFKGWLCRVAHTAALMHLRKSRRAPTPLDSDALDAAIDAHSSASPNALALDARLDLRDLARALSHLDPTNRDALLAVEVAQRPREEVAQRLGVSVPALKARLHRARTSLRDALRGAA